MCMIGILCDHIDWCCNSVTGSCCENIPFWDLYFETHILGLIFWDWYFGTSWICGNIIHTIRVIGMMVFSVIKCSGCSICCLLHSVLVIHPVAKQCRPATILSYTAVNKFMSRRLGKTIFSLSTNLPWNIAISGSCRWYRQVQSICSFQKRPSYPPNPPLASANHGPSCWLVCRPMSRSPEVCGPMGGGGEDSGRFSWCPGFHVPARAGEKYV